MSRDSHTIVRQIAEAAMAFQQEQTGRTPSSVTAVMGADMVVVTLHEVLSLAERSLAESTAGAAQLQEFHRQLFESSAASLRGEVERITGRTVHEAGIQVESKADTFVQVFNNGAVVHVFRVDGNLQPDAWRLSGLTSSQ